MSTISKVALYSLIAVGLSLFGTLIYFINSPKYVKSYYLKSNSSIPAIGIEIENASDETNQYQIVNRWIKFGYTNLRSN
jgi:hypothetical protein